MKWAFLFNLAMTVQICNVTTVDRHILIRFHHILIPPQFLPVSHCEAKGGKLTEKLLNKLIILDIGPTH